MGGVLVRWSFVIAGLLAVTLTPFFILEPSVARLMDAAGQGGAVAVFGFVVILLSVDVVLPVPSSIVGVTAGTVLGAWGGGVAIWLGLTLGCWVAHRLGARAVLPAARRLIDDGELHRARALATRLGPGTLVLLRAVPVLAEASVLAAGLVGMPLRRVLVVTGLANLGVAAVLAGLGAQAAEAESFMLAFAASLAIPALGWAAVRLARPDLLHSHKPVAAVEARLTVAHRFPVVFADHVLAPGTPALAELIGRATAGERPRAAFVVDGGLAGARPALADEIAAYAAAHAARFEAVAEVFIMPGGEAAKNDPAVVQGLLGWFAAKGLDRHSCVVALGGGAVLDAVGFAAATAHRGLRLVRLPSTVLAQNDAGIGVKNGINGFGQKNFIGCFAPPHGVLIDHTLLASLPDRHRRAGLAEAVKVALIRDSGFFAWLGAHGAELARFAEAPTREMVRRTALLHLAQITRGGDPFETGSARPLDCGHWAAHKLESLTGHALLHGEAVAIGLALDARYARLAGLLADGQDAAVARLLEGLGFALWHPALDDPRLLDGLEEFRQHLGGRLTVTLPTGLGHATEVHALDRALVAAARDWLRGRRDSPA